MTRPPDVFIFYGAESGTLVSGLIAFIALMSLFWLLLALGLWRKSRVMAVIGLVWSVLLLGGVALGFWEGMPQLPFILVVLAVLGVIGSFRYQKMRRLVVAGEPLADRKPHEWVPQSVIGKVGAVALCLFLVGSLALVAAAGVLNVRVSARRRRRAAAGDGACGTDGGVCVLPGFRGGSV